mmetsp:Transcript_34194/g.96360  ORF Transcript_34194/g.96360 Transcript_34194/m.96360 type:complete len:167 (-) Transcript_34194:161-661(-)
MTQIFCFLIVHSKTGEREHSAPARVRSMSIHDEFVEPEDLISGSLRKSLLDELLEDETSHLDMVRRIHSHKVGNETEARGIWGFPFEKGDAKKIRLDTTEFAEQPSLPDREKRDAQTQRALQRNKEERDRVLSSYNATVHAGASLDAIIRNFEAFFPPDDEDSEDD